MTCIFSFDFTDPIPNRFNLYLRIHLGDIFSSRCFLTVSDISASMSLSNAIGIQITLRWFTFDPLNGPVELFDWIFANVRKRWFIESFGTAEVLGIVPFAVSSKVEVNKDMGSSASEMAGWYKQVMQRCWN